MSDRSRASGGQGVSALGYIAEPLRPSLTIVRKKIADLHTDPANANRHPERNLRLIADSLHAFGQVEPLVVQKGTGKVIGGNGRLEVLRNSGAQEVDCVEIDIDGAQATALAIALNRTAKTSEFDDETLASLLQSLPDDARFAAGFDDGELKELLDGLTPPVTAIDDEVPEPRAVPVTRTGDVWVLGNHRVACGDSTRPDDVAGLGVKSVDCILTDPPYCSGGFQEAGRGSGSVGSDSDYVPIANDKLSTRGFMALLKSAFATMPAKYIFAFTDWRMWINLFDIAESSGFCVRSMIVWDKGTPGMGRGWRCQHELILWGCRDTAPFDKHASGVGNVITEARTGNVHHTTEKPVTLIAKLLSNCPFISTVYEPFSGSGTTLIACEQCGRVCYGVELDPVYVDVSIARWQKLTGKEAVLESTGKTWAETAAERGVSVE